MSNINRKLEKEVSLTLSLLGVTPDLKGHQIIKRQIMYSLGFCVYDKGENNDNGKANKKRDDARIRTAFITAYSDGKLHNINELIGIEIIDDSGNYTPKMLVKVLEEYFYYKQY